MDSGQFDRWFEEYLTGGFSGVVSIARGPEVLTWRAVGDANKGESIPNRLDTRFPLASGGKLLTGIATCQLVDSGRISLDTRLRDCVPHKLLGGLDERVTVGHLLTHTSGITSYFEEDVDPDYEALWRDLPVYRMRTTRDFLPMFVDKPAKFTPGQRFEYNDGGFVLLALVIEEVTGVNFTDHVREAVLAPAGMVDSGYFATDRLPARTAYGYLPCADLLSADGGWRTNVFAVPAVGGGDGGVYATAPDLARLWHAVTTGALLSGAMTERLLAPQTTTTGTGDWHSHYGLGVWLGPDGCRFVEGFDPGVVMISGYFPGSGLSATLLANVETPLWPAFKALAALIAR